MNFATSKLGWCAAGFLLACSGLLLGNSVRDRYERGTDSLVPSETYATSLVSRDDTMLASGLPASIYFDEIRRLLLNEYVDPVVDQTSMARGAAQYMLQDLGDTSTRYYNPIEWRAYVEMFEGRYMGIGADLQIREESTKDGLFFPLRVVSVVEGGPAAKAGIRPGDWIDEVNGKWVASRSLLREFEIANSKFAKKLITREQLERTFDALRALSQRVVTVFAALDELQAKNGPVKLKVRRGTKMLDFSFDRKVTEVAPLEQIGDTIRLRSFGKTVADKLPQMLYDKNSITLDLRGNPGGWMKSVKDCLSLFIPSGPFAKVQKRPNGTSVTLSLERGNANPKKVTVMVDSGTAREAELFANALRDRAGATIVGGPTSGLGKRVERFALPDGSGYTITSGRFLDLEGASLYRGVIGADKVPANPLKPSREQSSPQESKK